MWHPGLAGGRLFPVLALAESFNGNIKAGMDARQMQAHVCMKWGKGRTGAKRRAVFISKDAFPS